MKATFPEAVFTVVEEKTCSHYKPGDEIRITGKVRLLDIEGEKQLVVSASVKPPDGKEICRPLAAELTGMLVRYGSIEKIPPRHPVTCESCGGSLHLGRFKRKKQPPDPASPVVTTGKFDYDISIATKLLNKFPIFQSLNEVDIRRLVPMLKMKKFAKGSIIIKKGDAGSNLFIILSGKTEVLVDNNTSIGVMGRGDVFGEISLLIGTPASTTIKVMEMVTVLMVYGKDFKTVLNTFPPMQMYFARLLAQRLAKTNVEREEEFSSGMIGKLSENPPSELFQTLNLNHKTGLLTLSVSKGQGELAFREGDLIHARYDNKEGQEAFFYLLKEKNGRFKFAPGLPEEHVNTPEIGDFMWLLMEGTRQMDED